MISINLKNISMNRIIKFRAKPLQEELIFFVYGSLVQQGGTFEIVESERDESFDGDYPEYEVDENTIGQFTGLIDKKNKEIYEGDIVKGCTFNGSYALGKVIYFVDSFTVVPIGNFLEGTDNLTNYFIEVIGNIYENPELINGVS